MRLRLQMLTLLHLCIALLTMLRAEGASLWALLTCMLVVLGTTFFPQGFAVSALKNKTLRTGLILLLVGGSAFRAYRYGELIAPGVDLLLLLICERCLFRERLREQIQLLLLSSMIIAIAGVIHVGPDYPILLGLFVLTAMAHLGVWNLAREAERIGARAQYALNKYAQAFTRQLIAQNLRLGAGVLLTAMLVFLFFPRIGAGVFFRGKRASLAQAGFRDEVSLGHRSDIADNPAVVARVYPEIPSDGGRSKLDLYFRISAFDLYQDGRWIHSKSSHKPRLKSSMHRYYLPFSGVQTRRAWSYIKKDADGGSHFNRVPGWRRSDEVMQMRILQNDLGSRHLMLPSQTALVEWLPRGALERASRLAGGGDGQIKAIGAASGSMQFRVYARRGLPSAAELRAMGRPSYGQHWKPYLRIPQGLSPTLKEVSGTLSDRVRSDSQYDLVLKLMERLSGYRYTTIGQSASSEFADRDPIEGFLLDTKAGHCEYFATALVLLARSHGIPARVVNGYYGAYKNPIDGTFQISQSQAHAWAEIYFDKLGWIRFDATPAQERPSAPPRDSWLLQFCSLYQALETKYLEYVVDYDGKKQWNAVKGLSRSGRMVSRERLGFLFGGLGLALCLWVLWRRSGSSLRADPLARAQLQVRTQLAKKGLEIGSQENALSWARRAADAGMDPSGRLYALVLQSEVLRFGGGSVSKEQRSRILASFKELALEINASS